MEEALADLEATLKQHSDAIAAMILEPVVQCANCLCYVIGSKCSSQRHITTCKRLA
jgi:adenosylmethionine-8-amino-7-oxononanoate aminotransferase